MYLYISRFLFLRSTEVKYQLWAIMNYTWIKEDALIKKNSHITDTISREDTQLKKEIR